MFPQVVASTSEPTSTDVSTGSVPAGPTPVVVTYFKDSTVSGGSMLSYGCSFPLVSKVANFGPIRVAVLSIMGISSPALAIYSSAVVPFP